MKCTKTMLTTGAGLLAMLAVAYIAFPQFQVTVFRLGPYLLFLLCPLSMLFMMKGMNSSQNHGDKSGTSAAREPEAIGGQKMSPSIEAAWSIRGSRGFLPPTSPGAKLLGKNMRRQW